MFVFKLNLLFYTRQDAFQIMTKISISNLMGIIEKKMKYISCPLSVVEFPGPRFITKSSSNLKMKDIRWPQIQQNA